MFEVLTSQYGLGPDEFGRELDDGRDRLPITCPSRVAPSTRSMPNTPMVRILELLAPDCRVTEILMESGGDRRVC